MDAEESQIYQSITIALLILGVIISYFLISAVRHQQKITAIQRKNSRAEVTAMENERARIATDLHDDLAPMLVAIKMRINSFDLADVQDQTVLDKTNDILDDVAQKLRSISYDLMPASLQQKGLTVALVDFINHVKNSRSLNIQLQLPEQPIAYPDQMSIHLFRIVQEIVHNTIKHANAAVLLIRITRKKNDLLIQCKDNGIGFNYRQALRQNSSLGLRSLYNRVNVLEGRLDIHSTPGTGTQYFLQIPLHK